MDRGAWQATVHRIAKSWTRLKLLSMHTCMHRGGEEGLGEGNWEGVLRYLMGKITARDGMTAVGWGTMRGDGR